MQVVGKERSPVRTLAPADVRPVRHYAYLMPPKRVYTTTPRGRRKQPAAVGMPVKLVTTADPPVKSIAVTLHPNISSVAYKTAR